MFGNVLPETFIVEKFYEEYLKFVGTYQNINRPSIFCRYFNINKDQSTFNSGIDASFDRFSSGIRYDVLDYTPLFYASQVVNDQTDAQDLKGQMFQGSLSVNIYTVNYPRNEDLIIFPYAPQHSTEVFRVSNFRAAINAINSNPRVNWYELTLEYAPVIDLKKLNYLNHYVYSLTAEKYLLKSDFERMIPEVEKIENLLNELEKTTFNKKYELFTYTSQTGKVIAPLRENNIIYNFLATKKGYENRFETIRRPYGVKIRPAANCFDVTSGTIITCPPMIWHTDFTILDFNLPINIYYMAALVQKCTW